MVLRAKRSILRVAIGPRLSKSSASSLRQHSRSSSLSTTLALMAGLPRAALKSRLVSVVRHKEPLCRRLHSSPLRAAVAHPITAHGPPPKAPAPSPEFEESVESQEHAKPVTEADSPSRPSKASAALKKRFWKDVHVHGKPGRWKWPFALLQPNRFQQDHKN